MTSRPGPSPDDGPAPERMTPKRLCRDIEDWSVKLAEQAVRGRRLGVYTADPRIDEAVNTLLDLARTTSDLAVAVLVGKVPLAAEYSASRSVPERPLLDAIEKDLRVPLAGSPVPIDSPCELHPPTPNGKARKPPEKSFDVLARDGLSFDGKSPAYTFIQSVKAKNIDEARRRAAEIYPGQEFRRADGIVVQIKTEDLQVLPTPRTTKERDRAYREKEEPAKEKEPEPFAPAAARSIDWSNDKHPRLRPDPDPEPDPDAEILPPPKQYLVSHGPRGGVLRRVCLVLAQSLAEAAAEAQARIGWQVYNFPEGLSIDSPCAGREAIQISADRAWLPIPLRFDRDGESHQGDGKDQVPEACPAGTPRVYEVVYHGPDSTAVVADFKAVNKGDAQQLLDRWLDLHRPTAARFRYEVRPAKAEKAARRHRKADREARAFHSQFDREARREQMRVEALDPEPEPAEAAP